jgi:hypothetical protein
VAPYMIKELARRQSCPAFSLLLCTIHADAGAGCTATECEDRMPLDMLVDGLRFTSATGVVSDCRAYCLRASLLLSCQRPCSGELVPTANAEQDAPI